MLTIEEKISKAAERIVALLSENDPSGILLSSSEGEIQAVADIITEELNRQE